jgi:hypothetical protein
MLALVPPTPLFLDTLKFRIAVVAIACDLRGRYLVQGLLPDSGHVYHVGLSWKL